MPTSVDQRSPIANGVNNSIEPVPTLLSSPKGPEFLVDLRVPRGFRKTKVLPRPTIIALLHLGRNSQSLPCCHRPGCQLRASLR